MAGRCSNGMLAPFFSARKCSRFSAGFSLFHPKDQPKNFYTFFFKMACNLCFWWNIIVPDDVTLLSDDELIGFRCCSV
jgi:hypothetical protein